MKKILSLILLLVLMMAVAGCSLKPKIKPYPAAKPMAEVEEEQEVVEDDDSDDGLDSDHRRIANFVKEKRTDLVYSMSKVFEPFLNNPCITTVEPYKHGILFNVRIVDLGDMNDEAKDAFISAFAKSYGTLQDAYDKLEADLPELEFIIVNICEDDGDVITSIQIDE